jgi:uncharacterized protein (TIGR02099 family)
MSVSAVLNRWLKRLYKLLAISLVVFAVLISTLRLFLPYAHNYRENVEDYLNSTYNADISIGSFTMGWQESGPTLIVRQVELLSREDAKIFIDSLEVELDFWRSLRTGQLITQDFAISGAELEFQQVIAQKNDNLAADDAIDDTIEQGVLVDNLSAILLEQISRFSIRDSHVLYRTISGVRAFTINELHWLNSDDRHRANGTVIVDGLSSNNLKVLLDFQGNEFDKLTGQVYLEANEINITPWLGRALALEDENTHSSINFSTWLNVNAGKPDFIQVALGNNKISWQHDNSEQSFEIDGGDIQIKTIDERVYNVSTSPITIKRNGKETNQISALANINAEKVSGYINGVELASFSGVFPLLFDDNSVEELLVDLAPTGHINDIYFSGNKNDMAITAKFTDVNSHFSHGIPSIDNVSGELVYQSNKLHIALNAVDGVLDFDKHFKQPIKYSRLSTDIYAEFLAERWHFLAENVELTSSEISLTAEVKVVSEGDKPVTMALLATVIDGDAEFAEHYYPHLLMGENLYDYLDGAIVDGKIKQALVLFNGPLQSFPFDNHEGIFVVDAELSDSTFIFDPEWPAIKNFAANLNFTNNSMVITGREGSLSGIDVTGVEAAIANLSDEQILTVDASFAETAPKLVSNLMDASPMKDSIGLTLAQVKIEDVINGDFSLILPLNDLDAVVAKGYVDFKDNNVSLQAPSMSFVKVNGRLNYHNDLITASDIRLDWRGLPLTLNVVAQQKSDHYSVAIETLGQWQDNQWQAQVPNELIKYANGQLDWQGQLALKISDDNFSYDYQVDSTLKEVDLALPVPFDKTAGEKVTVNIHAFGDEANSTINAEIGDKVDFYGLLDHQKTSFSLAHLVLGKQQLWLPTKGFHITADLANANYQQWQPLVLDILASVEANPVSDSTPKLVAENHLVAATPPLLSAPSRINGRIKNLLVYGQDFHEVDFDFSPETNWWLLNLNAKEVRANAKFYPDWHQQGIDLDIDFLHLTVPEKTPVNDTEAVMNTELSTEKNGGVNSENNTERISLTHIEGTVASNTEEFKKPSPALSKVDGIAIALESSALVVKDNNQALPNVDHLLNAEVFANVPMIKAKCASCKYGLYDFGDVSFTVERENENTLLLNKFTAKRGKTNMAFDAKWQQDKTQSNTSIKGRLNSDNVAREVEDIGYVSIIKDSGVAITYDVSWQGAPYDFAMATFGGDLSAKFDDGYLADIDDKGVRILSLLSLQSLVRKLSFDFRDIFSDGMFYRELKGGFTVKKGVAYTDNVRMKGTAGDLTIVGNTNLNNNELDYRMSYKPNLTSSLPVLAWIATLNPVTFLAGVALDEVITSSVIAEINFEVTGNLDEPEFKQVSKKNKNISVGRSTPPTIVDNIPDKSKPSVIEQPKQNQPDKTKTDGKA